MLALPRVSLALLLALAPSARAGTWYVDVNGTPPGTGTLGDPYTSIQYAIDQPTTVSGDTLLVLPGTYLEQVDYSGKSLILQSTAGAAATVIDGSGACPISTIGGNGSVVTIASGEVAPTRLEGFTLTGGCGTDVMGAGPSFGGGLLVSGAQAEVVGCVVGDNWAEVGGGVWCNAADLRIESCVIQRNGVDPAGPVIGTSRGGGLLAESSSVELVDTRIAENQSLIWGCGLATQSGGTLVATRCVVVANSGAHHTDGAGAYLGSGSASFDQCTFQGNSTVFEGWGGAIYNSLATLTLSSCAFLDNVAHERPGGAVLGDATATDCLFLRNSAEAGGAVRGSGSYDRCTFMDNRATGSLGIFARGGAVDGAALLTRCLLVRNRAEGLGAEGGAAEGGTTLIRCTVVDNHAAVAGGGLSGATARTSILWGNSPDQATGSTITYSDVQGGHPGTANIDADPLFWDRAMDDYHLMAGSPCIDAGAPADGPDPDGSPADMGAFVFDPGYCPTPASYCTSTINSIGCSPAIAWSGEPTLSGADDFFVSASNLTNLQPGLLVWSLGSASMPFFGGTLCLAAPVLRTPLTSSRGNPTPYDCSGTFSFHFSHAYMASTGLAPGTAVHAQQWLRDPLDPSGHGIALSDGLRFLICP